MLEGKNILVIGARAGGYGEAIARAAVSAGAKVFGTTLNPEDAQEKEFFEAIGTELIEVPLRFDFEHRNRVFEAFSAIERRLRDRGVDRLDAVIHAVAGGFPRQPSVMKAVAEILKGKSTFSDMATPVKRNVFYVNAGSFDDAITGLAGICDGNTQFIALTYRGDLPYFISQTKKYLEKLALRRGKSGTRALAAALPEVWTQSSQFFTGIEIAVVQNYLSSLRGRRPADHLAEAFNQMEGSLAALEGFGDLLSQLQSFLDVQWKQITADSDPALVSRIVDDLFGKLRKEGTFSLLRQSVEIISAFVREASGMIFVKEFVEKQAYEPGDVRQVYYKDLLGHTPIERSKPREPVLVGPVKNRKWLEFDKEDVRATLSMYGKNFLFLDRVVMEEGDMYSGFVGFGRFTVPSPEENPILKDHFVDMPLFGGHLQMEAVAQFGTFMLLKLLKDKRLVPILTGTEFPDLNTMAPPGEVLRMMGTIHVTEKRNLILAATIENRFARSKGTIRGMVVNQRVVRKMLSAFNVNHAED